MTHQVGDTWLVRRGAQQGRVVTARLFCFPHAGVGASAYRLWAMGLPPALEVCAVQLPGRESRFREPPLDRIDAAVAALLPVLRENSDLPFAFFGHSMGAVVATELTLALAAAGAPLPHHLFVSARRPPEVPDPDTPLANLPDAAFLVEIQRRYGGIPAEVMQDAEMMGLLLPSLRADIRALENHAPTRPTRIPVPLSVFGGSQDTRVPYTHLEAWRQAAAGEFRLRMFAGDHFYLNPRRAEVLAEVTTTLASMLTPAVTVDRSPETAS
jgi:medium-chain acyl-[acyl-carrier-protein] hydrolase